MTYGYVKSKSREIKDDILSDSKPLPVVEAWKDKDGVLRRLRPTDPLYAIHRASMVRVSADKVEPER